jgi:chemotaxis protein methyltransferase CheR
MVETSMRDSEYDFICSLVYEHSRISLGRDKRELVSARLGKRLRATNAPDVTAYCQLLKSPGAADEELGHLIDAISTNHTFFFREIAHFDFLRKTIVPEMSARARAERWPRFNVWSAASSSGEEAYSIAITLADCLTSWPWQIQATDISRRILARAQNAIYARESVERLEPDVIRTHFQRGFGPQEGYYRIKAALRDHVSFHHLNLLEGEPPFHDLFQVIFCRNVMIYFDRPTQEELVGRLSRRLVPGGFLLVGHSESLSHIRHPLRMLRPATYQKPFGS